MPPQNEFVTTMTDVKISREDLNRLRTLRILPNLFKIPLFISIMGLVTFMHDATHTTPCLQESGGTGLSVSWP